MASDVFFIPRATSNRKQSFVERTRTALRKAGIEEAIQPKKFVAVKLHFGELGNPTALRPPYVRAVVEEVKGRNAKPFLVDTNTLYRGSRSNAHDHLLTAFANGFSYGTVGAPVIIGDGLRGKAFQTVPIDGTHFKEAHIAEAIYMADALVVLSHATGHNIAGFGGAIKNLAMGCSAPIGKRQQHEQSKPQVNPEKCVGDGECTRWCPANAIKIKDKKATIDYDVCIGCGECVVTCPEGAIRIAWDEETAVAMEKFAEYATAALTRKKHSTLFVTYLLDVTPGCDCAGFSDTPIVPDLGALVSRDPVAVDQAAIDLIAQSPGIPGTKLGDQTAPGVEKFRVLYPDADWAVQLDHAVAMGLGSREYAITEIADV